MEQCKDCRFYKPYLDKFIYKWGYCYYNPPVVGEDRPDVRETDFCGQYKKKDYRDE